MACSDPTVSARKVVVEDPDVRVRTLNTDGTFVNAVVTGKDLIAAADPKSPESQAFRAARDAYVAAYWELVASQYPEC